MKKRTLALALTVMLILSFTLTACAPKQAPTAQPEAPKAEPQVLVYNALSEPGKLDPQKSSSSGEIEILQGLLAGLMRRNGDQITPDMAESYEVSPDGLVYTFKLREGISWSDGVPVKAQDFEYAWKRALDPATASDYAYIMYFLKGGEEFNSGKGTADQVGVKAIDDKTLEVTLAAVTPFFPSLCSFVTFYPSRKDIVEKFGDKFFAEAENAVFNGPFTFAKWEHETSIILEKNPNYWNKDNIKLDKVEMVMVTDSNTELNMYLAGDLDLTIGLNAEQKAQVPAEELKSYNGASVWYLAFNQTDKAGILKNLNIRKALTLALNRDAIIKSVLKTPSKPAMAVVHPEIIPGKEKTFREEGGDFFMDNDIEGAKAALAAGLAELKLTKLPKLTFMTGDNDSAKNLSQALQEMWKQNLGIDVTLEPVPSSIRIDRLHKEDYQFALAGWGPDYGDPMTDLDFFHSKAGNNDFGFKNAEYDSLIEGAKVETDQAKRMDMLHQCEKILMDNMVVGPIYFRYRDYSIKSYVHNLVRFPLGAEVDYVFADVEGKPAK